MYLPRTLISHLYLQLVRNQHALSPPVLILAALEPDALCATRILAALLKRDYIPHKIKPISGYEDLRSAGLDLVQPMRVSAGGSGGIVVCLGVGGLVNLAQPFEFKQDAGGNIDADGIDVWVLDSRRPYNLANVFGSIIPHGSDINAAPVAPGTTRGQLSKAFKSGSGGIVVWDDGDICDELTSERSAHFALESMRIDVGDDQWESFDDIDIEDDVSDSGSRTSSSHASTGQKRKSWELDADEIDSEEDIVRPLQRRRSNSVSRL